ncbi:MAG: hypothetical protein KatS3mg110_2651 [Pirellulaceae bacterium]|nr:MAG: hypothetical protein KatS3mg110_2651 [Pirellulaceae bacterium]
MRWQMRKRLLAPGDIEPTTEGWQVLGVFNPGVFESPDGRVILVARVAEVPIAERDGMVALPVWCPGRGPVVQWEPAAEWEAVDRRVFRHRHTGQIRLSSVSHLRLFDCGGGAEVPRPIGRIVPEHAWELYGIEDARVTCIDGVFYMTYVGVSEWGICTGWAISRDGHTWQRQGILLPPDNKDVVFFPRKVADRFVIIHRPMCSLRWSRPAMWLAYSQDGVHFGEHVRLYGGGSADWDADRVGAGPPPVYWEGRWLVVYHGSAVAQPPAVGRYAAGVMVLDGEDPCRIMGITRRPLLVPEEPFERDGFVPEVVFPTGVICRDERLWLYYGAADTAVAVAAGSVADMLADVQPVT